MVTICYWSGSFLLLWDGIHIRVKFVEYDLDSNVTPIGMPGRPGVWVMSLEREDSLYSVCCNSLYYREDHRLTYVAFPARVFHVKIVSRVWSVSHYLLTPTIKKDFFKKIVLFLIRLSCNNFCPQISHCLCLELEVLAELDYFLGLKIAIRSCIHKHAAW